MVRTPYGLGKMAVRFRLTSFKKENFKPLSVAVR